MANQDPVVRKALRFACACALLCVLRVSVHCFAFLVVRVNVGCLILKQTVLADHQLDKYVGLARTVYIHRI